MTEPTERLGYDSLFTLGEMLVKLLCRIDPDIAEECHYHVGTVVNELTTMASSRNSDDPDVLAMSQDVILSAINKFLVYHVISQDISWNEYMDSYLDLKNIGIKMKLLNPNTPVIIRNLAFEVNRLELTYQEDKQESN